MSQSLSYSPEFKQFSNEMDEAIGKVQEETSKKFLELYRKLLKPFNTKRHKIHFLCGMGVCNIMIDDRLLQEFPTHVSSRIISLLQDIEDSTDWAWGAYLHAQRLN